ncbi:MAG: hypothetical protein KKB50_19040 [Planctomycetes bacterium]|nr:hypothetical protein [Planctomycetota bacterium]
MAFCSSDDPDTAKKMQAMFGPQQVDQEIRQAIALCWMMMPEDKKNPEAVAAEIRRIVDRALANLKEDAGTFGIGNDSE